MAFKSFLAIVLIACVVSAVCGLRIHRCTMSMPQIRITLAKKLMPAVIGLSILAGVPDNSIAEAPVVVGDVAGLRGDGGMDAFTAAARNSAGNKKALSNSDYQRALKGEIALSSGPRAVKRRVMAACKDDSILKTLTPAISSRECTQVRQRGRGGRGFEGQRREGG
jgi:hypothetical protein